MILVDADLLIYAHVNGFPQHRAARTWLDAQLNGQTRVGMPWASTLAFLRITTNHRLFERPEAVGSAWQQVTDWLAVPTVWVPAPTERHAQVLGALLTATGVSGNHVPDAHLAAIAIEHGLTLCSTDGDFGRFAGLRWENPLRG